MISTFKISFSAVFIALFLTSDTQAQETNPLQPFEFLIGGVWASETTLQTFEWGVGQQSVNSKLYFVQNDTARHVGDISWFWHPEVERIIGFGHSVEMEMNFFEYYTTFENPRLMSNEFYGYGGVMDGVKQYEKLEFVNENQYIWTYYNEVLGELKPSYSITFERIED